jgi:polar amino acid transport system substrate-binding protein
VSGKKTVSLVLILILVATILNGCGAVGAKKVIVATDATWAPFEFVDEKTKAIVGFDIDLMNAIAKEAGFQVEYKNVPFDPLLAGMASGQYDAAISSITITEERKKNMLFSDPYFAAGQLVVVQSSNTTIKSQADLKGKKVGAQVGTTGAEEAQNLGAVLKTYDDIGSAYLDLVNGQIEAVVADNPLAIGYVRKYEGKLKAVGQPFTNEQYGIAVKKGNEKLLADINRGLKAVQDKGLIKEYEQKWMSWFAQNQ